MKVRVHAMQRNIKRKFKNENLKNSYPCRLTKDGIYFFRVYFINYDNKLYEDIICLIYFILLISSHFVMSTIRAGLNLLMKFFKPKIKSVSVL